MNIVFTLEGLEAVGRIEKLVMAAQAEILRFAVGYEGSVMLIFEDTFSNVQLANIVSALLKLNSELAFAMASRLSLDEIQEMLRELGSEPLFRLLDTPHVQN